VTRQLLAGRYQLPSHQCEAERLRLAGPANGQDYLCPFSSPKTFLYHFPETASFRRLAVYGRNHVIQTYACPMSRSAGNQLPNPYFPVRRRDSVNSYPPESRAPLCTGTNNLGKKKESRQKNNFSHKIPFEEL
jgi:hypothetical protein